jgi:hypothetical protein
LNSQIVKNNTSDIKVLLVESHYRTRSWFEALVGLADIYIVSVMPEERKIFESRGVPKSKILNLHNPDLEPYETESATSRLQYLSKKYNLNVNEILLTDRTLRLKGGGYNLKYVYHVLSSFINFVEKYSFDAVFIEPTWTHELIISKVCERIGLPVYAPVKDKLLPNRFFVFNGHLHASMFHRNKNESSASIVDEALDELNSGSKPQYFKKFNSRNKLTLSKFKVLYEITRLSFLQYHNKNIQMPLLKAIGRKLTAIVRAPLVEFMYPFQRISELKSPFVMVTLHVQPEASIDVVGEKFSNQLEFVRQIVRTTPPGYVVVVKEHPHDFGHRSFWFYKALRAMSCVQILHPQEESREAIKLASLVISITGTSSLEAALLGVPAVTAVRMYFKDLMVVPEFNPFLDRLDLVLDRAFLWRANLDRKLIRNLAHDLWANSFSGNCGDFKTDPRVLGQDNIVRLRKAFSEILENHDRYGSNVLIKEKRILEEKVG